VCKQNIYGELCHISVTIGHLSPDLSGSASPMATPIVKEWLQEVHRSHFYRGPGTLPIPFR